MVILLCRDGDMISSGEKMSEKKAFFCGEMVKITEDYFLFGENNREREQSLRNFQSGRDGKKR